MCNGTSDLQGDHQRMELAEHIDCESCGATWIERYAWVPERSGVVVTPGRRRA